MANIFAREHLTGQLSQTKKWDVIVIGGGLAGYSAALAAHEGGARVLLLEKEASSVPLSGSLYNPERN